jgi:hypothetical protein
MSLYKEDIKKAKERLKAWWDHEILDGPCICYWYPREGGNISYDEMLEYFDPWYLAQNWDDIGPCLDYFEITLKKIYFKGENIPRFFPNYGPGIMAAIFGINPKFMSRTVWFNRDTSIEEIVPLLESAQINMNNSWYARLLRTTEFAAKRGQENYIIAIADLGGVLDILSSFLGPKNLILAMKRHPNIIDNCRAIILEKMLKVYDDLQVIVEKYGDGCNSWMNVWCSKRWYPIQCDFSAMLSPKWFKRFALPDIITQAEHLDYAIYHLDGPYALVHLDDLLAVPSINGIQWVPGAAEEPKCSDKWIPVYKKIQDAGKNIVIDYFENPEFLPNIYNNLNHKGLYVSIFSMDKTKLYFYLPEVIGGQGGSGDFRSFKRKMRK